MIAETNFRSILVDDATNVQLNWLVAKSKKIDDEYISLCKRVHFEDEKHPRFEPSVSVRWLSKERTPPNVWAYCSQKYEPTVDPSLMWPIIEAEGISLNKNNISPSEYKWQAISDDGWHLGFGRTSLIAAARCFVKCVMGEDVFVPTVLD